MLQSKAKEKIQSIPTSVVTISSPTASTVTSLTGGQAIQQQITMMQHQQLRKQQEENQLIQQQKDQLQSLLDQQKSIITKNELEREQDQAQQQHKHQLQTLLEMQKSIIITNHTQQQAHTAIQHISDHHLLQGSQESLPITILRTTSQNIGINSGVPIHQLTASTDQHSIVY